MGTHGWSTCIYLGSERFIADEPYFLATSKEMKFETLSTFCISTLALSALLFECFEYTKVIWLNYLQVFVVFRF